MSVRHFCAAEWSAHTVGGLIRKTAESEISHLRCTGHPLVVLCAMCCRGVARPGAMQSSDLPVDPSRDGFCSLFEGLQSVDERQQFFEFDPMAHQIPMSIGVERSAAAEPASCSE